MSSSPGCQKLGLLLVLIGLVGAETSLMCRDLKTIRWNPALAEITECFVTKLRHRIFPTKVVGHSFTLMGLKYPSKRNGPDHPGNQPDLSSAFLGYTWEDLR